MGDQARLEEINRELAAIRDRLIAIPDDAFAERYDLQTRRSLLRDEATDLRAQLEDDVSTERLLAELSSLRRRLSAIEGQRIDLVSQAGGGGTGGSHAGADGWGGVVLNQGIMTAQGAGEVQARIGRIKGILADRGVNDPGPV